MRTSQLIFWLLAVFTSVQAFALPGSFGSFTEASQSLFKRKGGGGGSRGGGSSSSGGGSSSSSSSGSSSGSRGNTGSSTSGSATGASRGTTGSNVGGRTTTGSGPAPAYNGYYGGGAAVPYRSGVTNGVAPYFIGGAALGFFPGLWLYGAWSYGYGQPWSYRNTTSGQNQTVPAQCLCEQYQECGCDNNTDSDYQQSVANNANISKLATVNGTQTLFINGTLPNGTTSDGGDEDPYGNAGNHVYGKALEMSGFWVVIAGVAYSIWFM